MKTILETNPKLKQFFNLFNGVNVIDDTQSLKRSVLLGCESHISVACHHDWHKSSHGPILVDE
jgi:hypothetical protein